MQSDLEGIFPSVRRDLQQGLKVLFTGTPCQVGGLKGYLQQEYDNLLTLDLVCHGVPSQQMLNENISYYTHQKDGRKIRLEFRRKSAAGRWFGPYTGSCIESGWFLTAPTHSIERRKYEKCARGLLGEQESAASHSSTSGTSQVLCALPQGRVQAGGEPVSLSAADEARLAAVGEGVEKASSALIFLYFTLHRRLYPRVLRDNPRRG